MKLHPTPLPCPNVSPILMLVQLANNRLQESKQDTHPAGMTSSEPPDEPVEELKMERKKPITEEELKEYEE